MIVSGLHKGKAFKWAALAGAVLFVVYLLWPVGTLFPDDYSRVVTDRYGNILRVTLARDGQLRFAQESDKLPEKYVKAVTMMEDRRFFHHPGIDPFLLLIPLCAISVQEKSARCKHHNHAGRAAV